MTTRRKMEKNAVDRAFLTGFALGHCLGMREATKEMRTEFETEVEALTDQMRAEVGKTVSEFRDTWGLGPPSPDRPKIVIQ